MNPALQISKSPGRTRLAGSVLFAAFLAAGGLSAQTASEAAPPAEASKDGEVVKLSPFTVNTERDYGYRAANSVAATRTDTPIKDVPLNIQVFTQELFDDLHFTNQIDIERYNASLVNGGADSYSGNPIQQAYNQLLFRGFRQNWGIRDGVREYDPVSSAGLSRVEIVKGPAAALYGLAYPGGIMNSITKQVDLNRNFGRLTGTIQTEGEWSTTIDANFAGDVAGAGRFGLRVAGEYTNSEDQRAHSEGKVQYYQVQGAWQPLPSTTLKFLLEDGYREKPNGLNSYSFQRGDASSPQSSVPMQILRPQIPYEWNWADGNNMRSLETHLYRGTIEQTVGDNFFVTGYVQYSERQQIDGGGWDAQGSGGADSWEVGGNGWVTENGVDRIEMGYSYRDWSNQMHGYGATAVYKLEVAQTKNTFTFGANVWAEKFVSRQSSSAEVHRLPFQVGIDVASYLPAYAPTDLHPVYTGNGYTHEQNSNDYYFAAWQMSAFDNRLKTNIGVNHTNIKLDQWSNGTDDTPNTSKAEKNSPLFGALYDITKWLSVFGVHSTSLFPDSGKDSYGNQFSPVVGTGNEFGFKIQTEDGKWSGTVSYYNIEQEGGSQNDPNAPNVNTVIYDQLTAQGRIAERDARYPTRPIGDLIQAGTQESKGFEVDLNWQPTRNWAFLFSYANNEQEVTEDLLTVGSTVGQSTPGHIKQQFSMLSKYTFTEGAVKGLSLGLGLQYADKALQDYSGPAATNTTNPYGSARYNPDIFYMEAFATYRYRAFGYNQWVQLNVKNLTEQGEYTGWKPVAGQVATERYEIPVDMRISLTYGIEF
jgi:outer membrane receptor protein involved in Fe transport